MTWLNRHRLYFVLVIFLGSNLLGCGESPSGTGTGTAESVETAALFSSRLQLSATTPADGATNVSTSSALTATFNRPVNPATVTGTTFTLTKNGETLRVTGIITTSDVTATFALPPGILLASDTLYTTTVTRGIKDWNGRGMLEKRSWSFTTGAIPDLTPPTVNATSPPSGATNVSTSSALTATFSEPIDPATVTATTFTLKNSANTPVIGNITTSGATVTFALPPGTPLSSGTFYIATLTTGIKDLAGNPLTANFTWSFTTAAGAAPTQGLEFPRNDQVPDGQTVRFKFVNPHLNGLPIYGPGGAGVTYIFKVRPKQHTGYYTTFFWGNDDGGGTLDTFTWHGGGADTYYGMHPYPQDPTGSSGTVHNWEISVDTFDIQNGLVVKNAWYTQAVRVWSDGSGKHHEFYWDWPNTDAAHKVTWNSPASNNSVTPPSPALTFGDAPWAPGQELCSCTLRGIQIYSSLLSLADIQSELAAPQSTVAGANSIWYLNANPTPTDISDKSGKGHHPAWVGNLRPTLYVGP